MIPTYRNAQEIGLPGIPPEPESMSLPAPSSPFSMSNPMLMMGLSLLASPRNPGQSLLAGASIANQAQRNQMYQQEMEQRRADREAQQSLLAQQATDRQQLAEMMESATPEQRFALSRGMIEPDSLLAQPSLPAKAQEYQYFTSLPEGDPQRTLWEQTQQKQPLVQNILGGPKLPTGYMWRDQMDVTQGAQPIPGLEEKDLTEGQRTAGGYAERMQQAEQRMQGVVGTGYDPASSAENLRGDVPLIGNYLASSKHQQYRQAQEDWVRAKLRRESGAVIADEEMAREIRTYFPQLGDNPEVIQQKKEARDTATQGLVRQSGQSFELPPNKQSEAETRPANRRRYNPVTGDLE